MSPLLLEFRGIVRVVERFSIRRAHPVESRNVLTGECRFLFCFIMLYGKNWLSVICCLDCWLGLFFLSQYLANLMHKICFTLFYFMPLHVSSTCAHHQEVKIALPSLWYHHTYRWPSRARDGHYMVQSPSWEANWFAAGQEIPRISRNSKVHYHTHKRPPPVSILGQPNPVHIPTYHLLEIHHNIIHPSTPRSPQCSLSLRFPQQETICQVSHPYKTIDKIIVLYIITLL